jgi:hypothetical protein
MAMGGRSTLAQSPVFQVRATGSLVQKPGCPQESLDALGSEGVERLCREECYNPSDERRLITRIEVVRIRPQIAANEPIDPLIQDAWQVFECEPNPAGCSVTFSDPDFTESGRDAVYYVRAIETPSMAINADGLRCKFDDTGRCLEVDACTGDTPASDDCLAQTEQRAWSSPITLEWSPL